MTPSAQIKQYLANWQAEREAIVLYQELARAESNPDIAGIYTRLAETEKKHAKVWEEKIQAAGGSLPKFKPGWRIRVFGWLARRFGPGLLLPTLAGIERNADADYDHQPEAVAAGMPQDERSHARIFGYLTGSGRGLEGPAVARLEGKHRSTGGNALRAGVLGANDGLVSNFSLVMGVAGAQLSSSNILITGLAGLLAGAISMALGEWLSVQSSRELYGHQISIEKRELETIPEEEAEELALIYQAKGLKAEEAKQLADRLLSDPASALDTLAREELGIDPGELGGSAWVAAITSFCLFAAGAIIPVWPFFVFHGLAGVGLSAASSALGLFIIGAGITLVTGRPLLASGLRQVAFGLAAAAVTYGIGRLVGVNLGG